MSEPSRTRVLLVLFTGVLMGALDIAIVGPALPAIQASFAVDSRGLSWVFNVYVLFYLVGAPIMAKLSDRYGRRHVYVLNVGLFGLGSVLVVLSQSFGMLLVGRAVQAFGAGGIFPVASAVIGDTFPSERRGRALGLIGAVFGLAFLVGPLLGGVLLRWSWHWLFLINIPLAALVIWQSLKLLPNVRAKRTEPLDLLGAGVLSAVLAALALSISQLDAADLPGSLRSARVWPFLVVAFAGAPLFWWLEKRAADPLLHPKLLASGQLRLVGAIAVATGLVEAGMVFLPALVVAGLDVNESTASFMLLPLVIALLIGAPTAGRLLDSVGAKRVIQAGLVLTVLGLSLFGLAELSRTSFYSAGVCVGLGLSALLGAPLRYAVMNEADEEHRGAAQGLLTLCLSVGQLSGGALVGGVAASRVSEVLGYQDAFLLVAAAGAVALMVSAALRGAGREVPAA